MLAYIRTWLSIRSDDRAVTALEYGLIAALIACAIIVAAGTLGTNLSTQFTNIAAKLTFK